MNPNNSNEKPSLNQKLGLEEMSEQEKTAFFEQLGTLALEAAYNRYAMSVDEEKSKEFQDWMEAQQDNENILEEAALRYPEFTRFIDEEMKVLHDNLSQVA